MRVLVACETSGRVRDAFRALGHEAWSCDQLPAEGAQTWHLHGDVRRVLAGQIPPDMVADSVWRDTPLFRQWDLLIAHPPCTYLCNSGVRWLTTIPKIQKPGTLYGEARRAAMGEAAELFADLLTCGIPRIAVENPVMHGHAREALRLSLLLRETDTTGREYFDQSIQPWQFGHGEVKRTCLWLRGLPALQPTEIVSGREAKVHRMSPGPERWRERSRTYQGVAEAMAAQWG